MCFKVSIWNKKPKVAKKDIVCYKIVNYDGPLSVRSNVADFKYIFGKRYYLNKKLKINTYNIIEEGYHSYRKKSTALRYMKAILNLSSHYIVECVIPEGSTYYINRYSGVNVSDSLIVKEIVYDTNS